MSIKSPFSLTGDNYLMDNADISSDFSFEDLQKSNLSSKTAISILSTCCNYNFNNIFNFL